MAVKWQIMRYPGILGIYPGILGGLLSPFSLQSSAGNFRSVIIQKPVLDWGHSELSLKLNCKFLLPIMAEKWQTKIKFDISGSILALRETSTLFLLCTLAQANYAGG